MGQIKYVTSIMFIALFTVALIGFAVNFASDNDAAIDISDDSELTTLRSDTESQIGSERGSTKDTFDSILNQSIERGETLEDGGVFSLTIVNIVPVMTNILTVGYRKIFGAGGDFGIFLTAFISIIVFLGVMYMAKTWLGRNPD